MGIIRNQLITIAPLLISWFFSETAFGLNQSSLATNRHSRQYTGSPYSNYVSSSMFSSPIEAVAVGVLVVAGLTIFGIPLLFMLMSLFNMNSNPGISLIPTATTSVNTSGRRKRRSSEGANSADPLFLPKIMQTLNTFLHSQEKMQLLQRIIS